MKRRKTIADLREEARKLGVLVEYDIPDVEDRRPSYGWTWWTHATRKWHYGKRKKWTEREALIDGIRFVKNACTTCRGAKKILYMWERPGGPPGNGWGACPGCCKTDLQNIYPSLKGA